MGEREEKKEGQEETEITDGFKARRDKEFKMSSFPTLQKTLQKLEATHMEGFVNIIKGISVSLMIVTLQP